MKATVKIKTKGFEESVEITVKLTKPNGTSSRGDIERWKTKMETKLHAILTEDGYPPSAIHFG